ncbi:hypothetical protein GGR53DRAFT_505755 [Hypoxylon sp. FL1150]|nr:hypothetical protein GGR53DRAFT_505755 [Hypoxylon sp. FL1150]
MSQRRPLNTMAHNRNLNQEPPFPPSYVTIREILEQTIAPGKFVNVIGLVKDRRSPIQTGGSDWKSALTIYDKSIEHEDAGLLINVFRPQSAMPEPGARDVVVARSIKVQNYRNEVSLITNRVTSLHVYSALNIPKPPKTAKQALEYTEKKERGWTPGDEEHAYVAWLYHSIDKDAVPDATTFTSRVDQSRNIREKFQVLSNVQEGQFYDIIGRVVKDPFDQMDKATLWISDYTENDAFYKFSWDPEEASKVKEGDPYGYTTMNNPEASKWPGPYGKRSIQVTCFGLHAEFVNKEVKAGTWVRLRNLQVKYGHNSNNLEGFLREDRYSYGSGVQVDIYSLDDPENADDRLKAALRRKRDYEKNAKKQLKSIISNKRKADGQQEGKLNSRGRRTEKRSKAESKDRKFKEVEELESARVQRKEEELGINKIIKCDHSDQVTYPVSFIVEPLPYETTVDKKEVTLTLPYAVAKYRANVRVVDFQPSKLEDFATWRKTGEYDCLSQCSSDSDPDLDEDMGTLDRFTGTKIWEWNFALQLEEADPKEKSGNDRIWVVVGNQQGQLLTDLTATDLRANPDDLNQLREQLFKLWGNLEELKQKEAQRQQAEAQRQKAIQKRIAAQQPPESSPPRQSTYDQAQAAKNTKDNNTNNGREAALSNKPFTCCIHQYGIEVPEENPRKANAGDGKRYKKVFGLYGTKIGS